MIELLAPAKDKICAKAAIDFGADAIYIGASEFGARKNVPNSLSDIEEIVEYAHKFNVKVYVTINTILTDEELGRAKKIVEKLEKIGVDAIIIQDMGLVKRCIDEWKARGIAGLKSHTSIPPYVYSSNFHASTQCDNRTPEKVKFLEGVGFSRVILARELSIEQIKEIRKQTSVELEAFIHGALCVSYSGQCYMSQLIGGRSANRGECAQPCRKKYSLVDEEGNFIAKDKHLLSLKDFNASKYIKELADAGVTSFKIEGRLKDENYVKNVVGYYRKLIDELGLGKTSSGKVLFDFEPDLEKSFNRGFTDYFLDRAEAEVGETALSPTQRRLSRGSSTSDIFSFDSPKAKGEYIGKVSKLGKDYFEFSFPSPLGGEGRVRGDLLTPQDGLYFPQSAQGCLVNKAEGLKIFPNKMPSIKLNDEVYRNFDSEFEKTLKNSKTARKISANIEFDLGKIKVVDEDANSAEISYTFDELAQNEEKMGANIVAQLKKSGDTEFLVEDVKILTEKIPFLPVSRLNELRRELLKELADKRIVCHCEEQRDEAIQKAQKAGLPRQGFALPRNDMKLDYRANILNQSAKAFYENLGFEVEEMAIEGGRVSKDGRVVMTCKHCLKYAFNICKSPKKLFLIDEKGKKYELRFNCEKCEMEIIF